VIRASKAWFRALVCEGSPDPQAQQGLGSVFSVWGGNPRQEKEKEAFRRDVDQNEKLAFMVGYTD